FFFFFFFFVRNNRILQLFFLLLFYLKKKKVKKEDEEMFKKEIQAQMVSKAPKMSTKLAERYSGLITALDPSKMLPGAVKAKVDDGSDEEKKTETEINTDNVMQRASIVGGRRKSKQQKKNLDQVFFFFGLFLAALALLQLFSHY
ncbi:hypothetical protein RFI_17104, partial [Reticulomyxa filosa]